MYVWYITHRAYIYSQIKIVQLLIFNVIHNSLYNYKIIKIFLYYPVLLITIYRLS